MSKTAIISETESLLRTQKPKEQFSDNHANNKLKHHNI